MREFCFHRRKEDKNVKLIFARSLKKVAVSRFKSSLNSFRMNVNSKQRVCVQKLISSSPNVSENFAIMHERVGAKDNEARKKLYRAIELRLERLQRKH